MFGSRRNALVKRLWRALRRRLRQDDPQPQVNVQQAAALFKRLADHQLEALVDVVESRGASLASCIHLTDQQQLDDSPSPHLLLCRWFRWSDLQTPHEIRRIAAVCPAPVARDTPCCNPYHWSRVCVADTPPLPYGRLISSYERKGWTSTAPTESLETGGTQQQSTSSSDGNSLPRPWCSIAYWELRKRVGRLFHVRQNPLAVFSSTTVQNGLCLASLAAHNQPENDSVKRTRDKIGMGLLLWRESDGVWIYNRSEIPLFVNSPTLDPPGPGPSGAPRTVLVYRVNPGYCIRIFDYDRACWYQQLAHSGAQGESGDGPFNPHSVRISVAKGWGPKYSRQCVTSCPCWLEILLAPYR